MLEQVSIAENAVERLRATPAGTLRVTAPTSFGGCVIAPLTATFLQRYPEVRIELDLTNRMVDLVEEGSIWPFVSVRSVMRIWWRNTCVPTTW